MKTNILKVLMLSFLFISAVLSDDRCQEDEHGEGHCHMEEKDNESEVTAVEDEKPEESAEEKEEELDMEKIMIDCFDTYPIEPKELDDFIDNIYPDPEDVDRLAKCYIHCIMTKTAMVNVYGLFDVKKIHKIITLGHQEELKVDPMETINECTFNRTENRNFERSYSVIKCLVDKELF